MQILRICLQFRNHFRSPLYASGQSVNSMVYRLRHRIDGRLSLHPLAGTAFDHAQRCLDSIEMRSKNFVIKGAHLDFGMLMLVGSSSVCGRSSVAKFSTFFDDRECLSRRQNSLMIPRCSRWGLPSGGIGKLKICRRRVLRSGPTSTGRTCRASSVASRTLALCSFVTLRLRLTCQSQSSSTPQGCSSRRSRGNVKPTCGFGTYAVKFADRDVPQQARSIERGHWSNLTQQAGTHRIRHLSSWTIRRWGVAAARFIQVSVALQRCEHSS